jgi:integrase
MSVRKRTWTTRNGERKDAWIVDYADQNGDRHLKTFTRKKDADAYAATVKVDVARGVHTAGKSTVEAAGAKWILEGEQDGLERATIRGYRQRFRDHVVPFLGKVKLSDLTVPGARDFERKLREAGRSPAMVKKVMVDLGAILAAAQERGEVAQNVVRSRARRKERGKGERRHTQRFKVGEDIPTPGEVRRIIAQLQGRWRPMLLTATLTGLRASELRGLRWDDIDLKKRELHVRQRADRFHVLGSPKSAAARRTIPLPADLVNTLREWKLACPPGAIGLAFPNTKGKIESISNIIARGLLPAQIAAGVVTAEGEPKYTGLHALRHFYASWLINRKEDGGLGLTPKIVQERMGHATLAMTMDVYGHLFPRGDDFEALDAGERLLLG